MATMKIRLIGGPDDGEVVLFTETAALNLIKREQAEEVDARTPTLEETIRAQDKKDMDRKARGEAPTNKSATPKKNKKKAKKVKA